MNKLILNNIFSNYKFEDEFNIGLKLNNYFYDYYKKINKKDKDLLKKINNNNLAMIYKYLFRFNMINKNINKNEMYNDIVQLDKIILNNSLKTQKISAYSTITVPKEFFLNKLPSVQPGIELSAPEFTPLVLYPNQLKIADEYTFVLKLNIPKNCPYLYISKNIDNVKKDKLNENFHIILPRKVKYKCIKRIEHKILNIRENSTYEDYKKNKYISLFVIECNVLDFNKEYLKKEEFNLIIKNANIIN
jgi:hypothetical protein